MLPIWLRQVQVLAGPDQPLHRTDALLGSGSRDNPLESGQLLGWGESVEDQARQLGLSPLDASGWILAPTLVDPHSVLEEPIAGRSETLVSLGAAAASGGYGTVALLPWAQSWRDRPERLALSWRQPMHLRLWGSFSVGGLDQELAAHADQLAAGAVGLASGPELPPLPLLERGLLLGEMGAAPLLLAARQACLTAGGFVREGVEALRAGWPPDPPVSESLPLQNLLTLAALHLERSFVLMNLSTAEAIAEMGSIGQSDQNLAATVAWWHLIADSGSLDPSAEGWRVEPSLGGPLDRQALLQGLEQGLITAVAVHHSALDAEEQLLPLDQRRAGVAGHGAPHGLVLPLLWQELVEGRGWSVPQLWQVLSWGGSQVLGEPPEFLSPGSRRWLLFDPKATRSWQAADSLSLAANQPLLGTTIRGQVRATGLTPPDAWKLMDPEG